MALELIINFNGQLQVTKKKEMAQKTISGSSEVQSTISRLHRLIREYRLLPNLVILYHFFSDPNQHMLLMKNAQATYYHDNSGEVQPVED
ncbi:hypothetical protein CAEBREN_06130 [Caenorhabditis brenneri]|uniref:Uncharacterized protein n=1 Tax=Caenorhabditis brenneri TaxID=135651 RepID=G0NGA8_CAEBE|nr:hypothetical protein CAEBREN_06130 [Caenorhabditis brenneri]